jgi:hypothetical protein
VKALTLTLATLLCVINSASIADDRTSDSVIKEKLLGYWGNPRHSYLFKSDGIIYMCPRSISTTTNRWHVKGGLFYWDSEPNEILVLTNKKFVFRSTGDNRTTFTYKRVTKKEAEGE